MVTATYIIFTHSHSEYLRRDFLMLLSMNDFLPGCFYLFAVVVIKCFMIGVNV